MNVEQIEKLVEIIEKSSLTEFSYKDDEVKITMSKLDHAPVIAGGVPMTAAPMVGAAVSTAVSVEEAAEEAEDEAVLITSPIVGTFYAAPAPDAAPFVKVGDHVKNGQTVCILEAMKLMNEIQSEFDCEIEAVLVSNEQKVEYGQPLFRVKKL
ncbi:MAG: acetyl-CoA carboxylase biotin carboxyl carrier protein [Eubacterium sp.]|nr:acetyl-CoA carboxylase biotin carboxyl carrier protein [Eubacterium sp.]